MAKAKKEVKTEISEETDPFIAAILKKGFDGTIGMGRYIPIRPGISSGSIALDLKLGGYLPRDRVIEYFGPPGSLKTTMALIAMKSYVDIYGYDRKPFIVEVEHSITEDFVEGFGIDPDGVIVAMPRTAEAGLDIASTLIRSGKCGFGIFDSVDAMESDAETQRSLIDQGMGELPKLMSRAMRKMCKDTIDYDCGIIFINQIRASMKMYGPSETTSGGNALPYYAHIRTRWKATQSKEVVGSYLVEPQIKKNKLAPIVLAESKFEVMSGKGVMKFNDYLSASKQIGVIVVKGPVTILMDGDKEVLRVNGKDQLKEFMDDPKNITMWSKLIQDKWTQIKGNFEVELSEEEQMSTTIEAE